MAVVTIHRPDVNRPIEINPHTGKTEGLDIEDIKGRLSQIESAIGARFLNLSMDMNVRVVRHLDTDLPSAMKQAFISSPHHHYLMETANLVVTLDTGSRMMVSPSRHDPNPTRYNAEIENKLTLACRGWWKANRDALRCISTAMVMVSLGKSVEELEADKRRQVIGQRLAVSLARQLVAQGRANRGIEDILAEYDQLN